MDQPPRFWGTPGTTVCVDCGSLISTPTNTIPGDWLAQHLGHTITTTLAVLTDAGEDSYVCAKCRRVFEKIRSDDDALEDSRRTFGEIPVNERATICDDCHRVIMAAFN